MCRQVVGDTLEALLSGLPVFPAPDCVLDVVRKASPAPLVPVFAGVSAMSSLSFSAMSSLTFVVLHAQPGAHGEGAALNFLLLAQHLIHGGVAPNAWRVCEPLRACQLCQAGWLLYHFLVVGKRALIPQLCGLPV